MRFQGVEHTVKGSKCRAMTFTIISVAGELTRPVRTIEAKDRHEALAIAQSLYPDSDLAVVCNED